MIQQSVRNTSDLAGRFGGEEFIVVIKDINAQKTVEIANNIRISIEQTSVYISDGKN
jgi:diguanylate cyclase (GGDEF)-like protein